MKLFSLLLASALSRMASASLFPHLRPPSFSVVLQADRETTILDEPSTLTRRGIARKDFRILEYKISDFVSRLKTHISEQYFDVIGFEAASGDLDKRFAAIVQGMERGGNRSHAVKEQFRYSRQLFQLMGYSMKRLKHFSNKGSPGSRLVYKVIELNVRALALYNSHGEPDYGIYALLTKASGLEHNLYFWRDRFHALKDVPLDVRRVFHVWSGRANITLAMLKSKM